MLLCYRLNAGFHMACYNSSARKGSPKGAFSHVTCCWSIRIVSSGVMELPDSDWFLLNL